MIVHAGLIAMRLRGRWRGALIEGPAGAGKSDLALRCLQQAPPCSLLGRIVLELDALETCQGVAHV